MADVGSMDVSHCVYDIYPSSFTGSSCLQVNIESLHSRFGWRGPWDPGSEVILSSHHQCRAKKTSAYSR